MKSAKAHMASSIRIVIYFTIYLAGLVTTFLLCVLGRAISGYEHFGQCGRIFHEPAPREPTVGETMIEEYRKANPKRTLRTKLCPRCHQKCLKENNNNNHLKCWACKTGFCYQCGKEIKGAVTMHFTAASSCTHSMNQHQGSQQSEKP